MKKKKILVTGCGGMMASHCTNYMIEHYSTDFDVYGVDDLSGCFGTENIHKLCHFTKLDLVNQKKVDKYFYKHFKEGELDTVFHYAADAQEIRSYFTPYRNTSRIYDAWRSVLINAIRLKVRHVVFFTSMARYGSGVIKDDDGNILLDQTPPFKETYIPFAEDPYGAAKIASEHLLKSMNNVHDFTWTIFVPHNALAPQQYYVDPYRNVISIWINLIIQNKTPVIYGDGMQTRAISWVSDYNPVICKSIFNPDSYYQTFNIGGEEYKTLNEWYDLVREVTGFDKEAVHMERRPGEVRHAYCSHEKAKTRLGFKNTTPIKDAIQETWEYIKRRGPKPFKYLNDFEIDSPKIPTTWKQKLF